jgi:hypothetical protein
MTLKSNLIMYLDKMGIDKSNKAIYIFSSVLNRLGVSRAIGYGVITRLWGVLAGPINIYLIATRFSKVEQGYYYTFSSLLALQVFFELGLITVMAQFAAHEFAFLSWGDKGEISGKTIHQQRFLDLLTKGVKWYAISAFLLIITIIPAGLYFFYRNSSSDLLGFSWRLPWVLAVIGVAVNLMLMPFYSVIIGSGDVASVNRRQMMGGITGSFIGWIVIMSGGGLYAIPAVTLGSILIGIIYLLKTKSQLVSSVMIRISTDQKNESSILWWQEVWPMQWKVALSWVSGYFIFQLFTPMIFKYHGPILAGKVGMTLTTVNAVQAVSLMWLNTKSPKFGRYIAFRKWDELDREFHTVLKQAMIVCFFLSLIVTVVVYIMQQYDLLGSRFLPLKEVVIFLIAINVQICINGMAIYMRAHKKEPMVIFSLVGAFLVGISTIILGNKYSSIGMAIGFCLVQVFYGLPSTYLCFKSFKKLYQR